MQAIPINFIVTDVVEVTKGKEIGYRFVIRKNDKVRRMAADKRGKSFAWECLRLIRSF